MSPAVSCAQRLSASKSSAHHGRGVRHSDPGCSTPFGIKEFCTQLRIGTEVADELSAQRLSASKSSAPEPGLLWTGTSRCSTPFGIKEFCTGPSPAPNPASKTSAQRLSASKSSAPGRRRAHRGGNQPVLNAFRHQRVLHARAPAGQELPLGCSTPFGIKEFCTHGADGRGGSEQRCSTPFGIKEFCTLCGLHTADPAGAQRLSASKSSAQILLEDHELATPTCSTPFGIKEFCTSGILSTQFFEMICVLNAFRHQRVLHTLIRISARGQGTGAQRLSASKSSAQNQAAIRDKQTECSTPFGIKEFCTAFRGNRNMVLCAQRLSASKSSARNERVPVGLHRRGECSTPFGIKEFCTCRHNRRNDPSFRHVLNAFRHQRVLHNVYGRLGGIDRVLNAFRHQRVLHKPRR